MNQHDDPHWVDKLTNEEVDHRLRALFEELILRRGPIEIDGTTIERLNDLLSYVKEDFDSMAEDERMAYERACLKHIYRMMAIQ